MLKQLIHNGVLVPQPPSPRGLKLEIRGEFVRLTPKQEEMALAWAKKHGTQYVEDPVFIENFMTDFSRELGCIEPLSLNEVNFGPAISVVLREKAAREALTKEQRKELAAQRKTERERLKERYGFATVNGRRVEIGGYVVEPSGIFMGRGEHPLRGRWKAGAGERDITLNLSPDAPRPAGDWGKIVWQPENLWVARWVDKLSGKLKYIWISDTAPVKQKREAEKFDKAAELGGVLEDVRDKIDRFLTDSNPRRKMVATACYLIDVLCLRVGDEKDEDEADTVGATTLRPEHVTLGDDGKTAEFNFLGKDSVEWNKTVELRPLVFENLRELIADARPSNTGNGDDDKLQIFPLVTSRSVNRFLSSVMPGLTAKVFRTHHATKVVRDTLEAAKVQPDAPEYVKWEAATQANLAAAELCNHTKQSPANWPERVARMHEREQRAIARVGKSEAQLQERKTQQAALLQEREAKLVDSPVKERRAKIVASFDGKLVRAQRGVEIARTQLGKTRSALDKEQARVERYTLQVQERGAELGTLRQERDAKLAACTTENQREKTATSYQTKIARAQSRVDKVQQQLDNAHAALSKRQSRLALLSAQLEERTALLEALPQERDAKLAEWTDEKWHERVFASFEKKVERAERRVELAQERLDKAKAALGKLRAQMRVNGEKRSWNLGTSLKSYIDPRVYYRWGRQIDYDVLEKYYPTALRRKFAWVRNEDVDADVTD